ELSDKTTIVVGASRGLGRGIATALAESGAKVVAVARSARVAAPGTHAGTIEPEIADAADARVPGRLLGRFMTAYAQDEAERAALGIAFTAVLPGSPRSPTSVAPPSSPTLLTGAGLQKLP
ncbi:MAG: hypothetical protein QOG59_608, partial [Solirubrobacteraceae bacterium]|nr:hypothetical protein [Solirubrobacteraceae bacterium]